MNFQKEKVLQSIINLNKHVILKNIPLDNITITSFCPYKTSNTPPPLSEFHQYNNEYIDFPADSHVWLHFETDIPEQINDEKYFLTMKTGKEGLWDACNPQCSVFVNGTSCTQAFDTNHTDLLLDGGHKDIYIYFYSGKEPASLRLSASIITKSKAIQKLIFDFNVPYEALLLLPEHSFDRIESLNVLDRACNELDFRMPYSADFWNGIEKCTKFLEKEYYQKLCSKDKNDEVAYIGHTHIDVAWLWTLAQTKEKAQRSFSTVINLMQQYPDYIFMSSQPQLYEYVKENDPELYEKIKQKVKEGKWEPEGAMWLEADTNITGGESLIRQIMYGKKFMMQEFGVDCKILWLPDVFGYSAALPQILKKCGIEAFFTSKINWNETNKFPHDTFIWQGLDKTEILAIFAKNYVNFLTPKDVQELMGYHIDKKYTPTVLAPVGYGDGGGGVTFEMLENLARLEKGLPGFPKVTMRKASETIKKIRSEFEESTKNLRFTPKWSGELYLEMHRGTYTSIAKNKKNNRQSEILLSNAESASSIANLLCDFNVPKAMFDENWKTVLRNQFHDIIPGSSIKEVYQDSDKEYANVLSSTAQVLEKALENVAHNIKTNGGYLVFNPTSFETSDILNIDGKEMYFENIPAHGYAVITPKNLSNSVHVGDKLLENDKIRVTFDEKYQIISIFDKENNRELIENGKCANVLEVYEDYPRDYDAWEITEYYMQKKWICDNVNYVEKLTNDLSAGFKIERKYGNSIITQKIVLKVDSSRLDFETEVDWHEDHVLLKATFPLDIHSDNLTCDIQFGNIKRPTHRNTSWDRAKFEICCHKWADLSESDYGVSLLNDCKYGYSCEENKLSITLLKAPTYPNPTADRGLHTFTYSLFPHKGADLSATIKEGYKLNNPMTAVGIPENKGGNLSESFGFVKNNSKSVVVETIKKAEDGDGYIIRMYEAQNLKEEAELTFGFDIKEVYECDCLENTLSKLDSDGRCVKVRMRNFEIKTLRIKP